ncbi:MAG TPA: FkbM family methyltransferase [Myxococcales bacterium]|nr:FkbM family methyltransferase [Myxococcales bacterium]
MSAPVPSSTLSPHPPLWASVCARVVRHLPVARYRVMNFLSRFRPSRFVATLSGPAKPPLRFECDLRNALAREVFFTGQYEPQETLLVRALLRPGQTFVDVGAHWGYFTLLAAGLVGEPGRVVAFEADPRVFDTLATNLAMNRLPHVTAKAVAVAATEGTVQLLGYSDAQENWGISRIAPKAGSPPEAGAKTFEVPARPLDAMLDELGVGPVDLVKMDIEGAEVFALQGMQAGIAAGRYRRVLLELHPAELRAHGVEPAAVIARLRDAGYQGLTIDHSAAITRRAAYGRRVPWSQLVRPMRAGEALDAWPHTLWLAPGVAPPPGVP